MVTEVEARPLLSGAGGYWQVIDEVASTMVIQQQDSLSCGPACAEMLLQSQGIINVSQAEIARLTGVPVNVPALATVLNQVDESGLRTWIGGFFEIEGASDEDVLGVLMETGSWIADLRETGGRLGHLVVVDGYDDLRRLCIRDPWEGTTYKIETEEFLKYWTLSGIYARPI